MRSLPGWARSTLLVAAAFAGGAATSHLAHAGASGANPYGPFDQLARVLVLVENEYVDATQRPKITEGAVKGMVAELDPHSAYMSPAEFALFQGETEGRFGGVGVEVDFRNDYVTVIAPIEGSPAAKAGVRPGDQIVSIDGKSMRGERIDKLVTLMRGAPGTKVKMTVRRAGAPDPITFELTREVVRVTSVTGRRLVNDVAYLRLKQFQDGTHAELLRVIGELRAADKAPLRGVILDMRNNPGGLVDQAEAVADEFLDAGVIYTTRHRGRVVEEVKAGGGGALADVPVVILVNAYSASSAELVSGALQDNKRATVVGAGTFGKGSVQTIYDLPGGAGMRLTTMRYYTPSGRSIQADGIHPDVPVEVAKGGVGEVVRERDLEGHLPAEGVGGAGRAVATAAPVVVEASGDAEVMPGRDVPADPTTGKDPVLAVGYRTLLKAMGSGSSR